MKYCALLFGYDKDTGPWDTLTEEQQGAEMEKHGAFAEACATRDDVEMHGGEALMPGMMSTTLRREGGNTVMTDGPYAEATEQIGGFYVVEAPDLDTMIELCKILPAYDMEIRPVQEFD